MTEGDAESMRTLIIFALVSAIMAVVVIPAGSTDADDVAEIYFFDEDGDCVAQVYLIPGDKIKDKIPPLSSVKGWYDEDANPITALTTFSAGTHIIREHSLVNPPEPPEKPADNSGIIIGAVGAVIGVLAVGALAWVFLKK
jgi:hypothetical protein